MSEVIEIIKPTTRLEAENKQKAEFSKAINMQQRLLRLMDNPDFQEVVLKGYLVDHLQKLGVYQSSLSLSPEYKAHALEGLKGIGHFAKYLEDIDQKGRSIAQDRSANYLTNNEPEEDI